MPFLLYFFIWRQVVRQVFLLLMTSPHLVFSLSICIVFFKYVNPFIMCFSCIMYSRCLALPPHSVWVILARAVPWCSALTLWTTLLSEPESLSVCAPLAAQPKSLSVALVPVLPLNQAKGLAPTIVLALVKPGPSIILHYGPSQHNLIQASALPNTPPPLPLQLSKSPLRSTPKTSSQNLSSTCPYTYPLQGSSQSQWLLCLLMPKRGPFLNHAERPRSPWTHAKLSWPVLAGRLCCNSSLSSVLETHVSKYSCCLVWSRGAPIFNFRSIWSQINSLEA